MFNQMSELGVVVIIFIVLTVILFLGIFPFLK